MNDAIIGTTFVCLAILLAFAVGWLCGAYAEAERRKTYERGQKGLPLDVKPYLDDPNFP